MKEPGNHIIKETSSIKEALERLNVLAADAVLFVCNPENQLIGSLTDAPDYLKDNEYIQHGYRINFNSVTEVTKR